MRVFDDLNLDLPSASDSLDTEFYIWPTRRTIVLRDAKLVDADRTVTPSHHSCVHPTADEVYRGSLIAIKDEESNEITGFMYGGIPVEVAIRRTDAEYDDVSVYIADSDIDISCQL